MLYYLLLIPAVLSTAWIYFLSPALSYWWLLPILIGCFAAANLVYVLLMFVCSWFAGPNKMYTHISPFYHALTMALDGVDPRALPREDPRHGPRKGADGHGIPVREQSPLQL